MRGPSRALTLARTLTLAPPHHDPSRHDPSRRGRHLDLMTLRRGRAPCRRDPSIRDPSTRGQAPLAQKSWAPPPAWHVPSQRDRPASEQSQPAHAPLPRDPLLRHWMAPRSLALQALRSRPGAGAVLPQASRQACRQVSMPARHAPSPSDPCPNESWQQRPASSLDVLRLWVRACVQPPWPRACSPACLQRALPLASASHALRAGRMRATCAVQSQRPTRSSKAA